MFYFSEIKITGLDWGYHYWNNKCCYFSSLGFDAVHRQTDKNINSNKAFILKSFFYQHMQVQLTLKLKN